MDEKRNKIIDYYRILFQIFNSYIVVMFDRFTLFNNQIDWIRSMNQAQATYTRNIEHEILF